MSFFEDTSGALHPIDAIAWIAPFRRRGGVITTPRAHLKSDSEFGAGVEIHATEFDRLQRLSWQTIPASPGNYLLIFSYEPDLWEESKEPYLPLVEKFPILAWRVDDVGALEPLAYGAEPDLQNEKAVLFAAGGVIGNDGEVFKNVEEWSARMKSIADDRKANPALAQ